MGPVATPRVLESTFVVGKMMNAPQGPQEVFRKGQSLESPRVPLPHGGGGGATPRFWTPTTPPQTGCWPLWGGGGAWGGGPRGANGGGLGGANGKAPRRHPNDFCSQPYPTPGGGGCSVLDANYPPKLTVGRRPPWRGAWEGGGGSKRGEWGGGLP